VKRAGYSRFIKGELGSGKTMLAFEIFNGIGGNTVVYLSTRVSLPTLFLQFPGWGERTDSAAVVWWMRPSCSFQRGRSPDLVPSRIFFSAVVGHLAERGHVETPP
jgi:hypothetical protein